MTQSEVFEFLQAHKNTWFTASEIAKELGVSYSVVTTSCRKLKGRMEGFEWRTKKDTYSKYEYCFEDRSKKRAKVAQNNEKNRPLSIRLVD